MSRKFDQNFMIEEIIKADKLLKSRSITKDKKEELKEMIDKFNMYIDENAINKKENNNYDKMDYKKLEKKLNRDLKILPIGIWNGIKYLYDHIEHYTFEVKSYNNINKTEEEMFSLILDFYQNIDEEYYQRALQIIQCPTSLINFDKNGKVKDECFRCDYLKAPFINVKSSDDNKYISFVHELQHGIDLLVANFKINNLLIETSSIFAEILFTDLLYDLYGSECLYSARINEHMCALDWLNAYATLLINYDKNNRKVTKHNIMNILDVDNKDALLNIYKKFMRIDFINYFRYVMSMFMCLELREMYYNGNKKEAISKLKNILSGQERNINFSKLADSFNNYIEETKEKSHVYMKTVK